MIAISVIIKTKMLLARVVEDNKHEAVAWLRADNTHAALHKACKHPHLIREDRHVRAARGSNSRRGRSRGGGCHHGPDARERGFGLPGCEIRRKQRCGTTLYLNTEIFPIRCYIYLTYVP